MTDWAAFAGITTAVLLLLLALARASRGVVSSFPTREDVEWLDGLPDGAGHLDRQEARIPVRREQGLSTGGLLVNVALSQGFFLVVLVAGAWYAQVPPNAFGVSFSARELALGVGFGLVLSVANTGAGAASHALGYTPSEELRKLLAPDSTVGWILLLGGVLPTIAVFEEFLFRGTLVGAFAVGSGVSPWVLAVVSSVAFALGHGAQGPAGIAVTGVLGFVLAAGYVLTGSLLVVVVAHYLVNALEFVVYEGLSVEFAWQ